MIFSTSADFTKIPVHGAETQGKSVTAQPERETAYRIYALTEQKGALTPELGQLYCRAYFDFVKDLRKARVVDFRALALDQRLQAVNLSMG